MANKSVRVCLFCGVVFLVAAGIFKDIPASGRDYLPQVGPVPLRFSKIQLVSQSSDYKIVVSTNAAFSPVESAEKSSPASASNSLSAAASQANNTLESDTNWLSSFVMPNMGLLPLNPARTNRFVVSASNPVPAKMTGTTPSANDLLTISPDMLVNYFKHTGIQTNQADVSVFVPLEFIPPTATSSGSSQAVYQSQ